MRKPDLLFLVTVPREAQPCDSGLYTLQITHYYFLFFTGFW